MYRWRTRRETCSGPKEYLSAARDAPKGHPNQSGTGVSGFLQGQCSTFSSNVCLKEVPILLHSQHLVFLYWRSFQRTFLLPNVIEGRILGIPSFVSVLPSAWWYHLSHSLLPKLEKVVWFLFIYLLFFQNQSYSDNAPVFQAHDTCASVCLKDGDSMEKCKGLSPLLYPLLFGWQR